MLAETGRVVGEFGDRATLRSFELRDLSWIRDLKEPVRAFVSCLVVHHLDGTAKRRLYGELFAALETGGALLLADVIEPASPHANRYFQRLYEDDVRAKSLADTGALDVYQRFVSLEWNLFRYPDPIDMPSKILDHIDWLREAGFTGVEVFWARSGHALYGGYKRLPVELQPHRVADERAEQADHHDNGKQM
jgi:tRNA (cmo5U34)-methyltransferase